ncbi:NADH dehydrogenase [ubiquinone] 1 beta subcomplex subunit 9-like [Ruditapes philippinarum]|uniref:NADH dehydrogenase [ubiquinone] 1 beta subcomplex subunit 9-like n=1 Tax=Ruditapes philippinarum TaxID=129788 RepID=UPI00295AD74E|nr:NADH dehydrogenase [ubiquinone] 1 beta subcomplex subunit 9-like [Ruditapes philippinarum]
MSTNILRRPAYSHAKKVCTLYKKGCRAIESEVYHRKDRVLEQRYLQVLLRDRFDKNKQLAKFDAIKAYEDGLRELHNYAVLKPKQFPHSPGGVAYGREPPDPDYIFDGWHPLEKAKYPPEYFAKRDVRKREFLEREAKLHRRI